jgi:hypothetical protein
VKVVAKTLPTQARGHLLVAALRVLRHSHGMPPHPEEIATLLGWGVEETYVVVRELVDHGVLRMHETPFEVRLDLIDHHKLDELPVEEGEALQEEVDQFRVADRSRKDKLDEMFKSGEIDERKRQQAEALEKQFAEFRKKKPRPPL